MDYIVEALTRDRLREVEAEIRWQQLCDEAVVPSRGRGRWRALAYQMRCALRPTRVRLRELISKRRLRPWRNV
jgi:hypothetical protein